jgi:DNA-binding SARP family transcriptional activator/tetratricopeptide (TPR) repeat protein
VLLVCWFLAAARFIGSQGQDDPTAFAPAFAQAFECDKFEGGGDRRMKTGTGKERGLQIRLLGELALLRNGRVLPLPPSKKTRALLAYLAATGKPQLREHLCTLLWDGPDDPRAQLRWSLSKLRSLLDEGKLRRLRADRERIALDVGDLAIDVEGIRAATRQGLAEITTPTLSELALRFAGTFLDGLELSSCYRFHAWCVAQREQLHAEHVTVVTTLIERLRASPEQALGHARTLLALDPLAESSHITVVRLLKDLGRTREALEQYERCRQLLAHELGGKPSREFETLRMAIGKGPVDPPPAPAIAAQVSAVELASSGESPLPLVGRTVEIAQLEERLHAAAQGRFREVVLLVGDPGIGKSRMLEELAAVTRRSGGHVLSGRAFEAELVRPYGAWIDALRRGGNATSTADQLLPDFLPPSPGKDGHLVQVGGWDRNPMFERVVDALGASARSRAPLLLLLDDIQWMDEASAALLHFVARALDKLPLLLACAAREGELSDNPAVLRLVRTLEREHRLHRMALPPLGAGAITDLVAAVAHDVDASAVRTMIEGCEGNPLFAIEMARAHQVGEKGVAQSLRVLIGERLDRLDEKAQSLLPFAAAMGRSFDPQILARVQGIGLADLFSALGALERRGIFRATGPGVYDFSHDLIRQAAYQQLSEPRRRLVHLQLARVLSSWPDRDGDLSGDLAHHAALGGDSETAARAYLTAAQRCVRLFAWGEASELCRRGIEQLPRLDRATRLHLHVELLGAEVMGKPSAQRGREIDVELLRALTAAEEAGLHSDAVRGYYLRSVVQFRSENAGGAAETSWRAVTVGRSADAVTAARSQAEAGRCLILIEREIGKAKELLEGAHAVLVNENDDLMLTWGLGLLKRYTGEPEEATTRLHQAAVLARRIDSHWEETECLRALTLLALEQGDVESARALCPLLLELAVKMGEGSERPIAEALESLARVLEGDGAAENALDVALERVRDADAKAMLATVLNFAAEHDLARGRLERAHERASEALSAAQAVGRHNQVAIASATLAHLAIRASEPSSAREYLDPLRTELTVPFALSAYARNAVERALSECDGPPAQRAKSRAKIRRPSLSRST